MIDKSQIEKRLSRIYEIEASLADTKTVANQKKYKDILREHAALLQLKEKADRFFKVAAEISENKAIIADSADQDLKELASLELEEAEKIIPLLEKDLLLALIPQPAENARNAIMEIRAGTGGDEAALFAGVLFRMYNRFAESKGWKINTVDASAGDVGGYKEIVFTVEGREAYGTLRFESGVHRVQRVPTTEASGRIHTSAATVAVFPEADPDDDIDINPEELRIDLFCASGPGGQSVNTAYSAVRITHLPTGVVVQSQDERSQRRNKDKAMAVLKARLIDNKRREEAEKKGSFRRTQIGSGDRSERIRTYNFPQNRLTDHRINLTLYSLDSVVEGDMNEITASLHSHETELMVKNDADKSGT